VRLGGTEVLLAVRAEGELGGGDAAGGAAREPRLEVVVELAASVAAARDERLAAEARSTAPAPSQPRTAQHGLHEITPLRLHGAAGFTAALHSAFARQARPRGAA
jgi:hypothetical protein